jgi:uncharacterized repeat protein (TIGR01451 family)
MFNHTIFTPCFITVFFTTALLTTFTVPTHTAEPGAIKISSIAEKETEVIDKNGNKTSKRTRVDTAVPGDEIIYTTTFENISTKPASNIVITNPIPNDTTYMSASGVNTEITFSIDGNNQYATPDKLIVTTKEGDTRLAVPSDYSHLRWVYTGELGVGKTSQVSFRAVIK